jgi:pimeloyl-ACP methyl ester carboxylesterase
MSLTVVLVHGAYAESASWSGVISRLHAAGHKAIAFANPLRSLSGDAAALSDLLSSIDGPVVLVGHSYGGAVASNAALGRDNVKALVFVAALAPEAGENVPDLTGEFPGAPLASTCTGCRRRTARSTSTWTRTPTTSTSPPTSPPSRRPWTSWRSARSTPRRWRSRPARRPGRASRPGSSTPSSTAPSPPRRAATWPNAPAPAPSWRCPARPTRCPRPEPEAVADIILRAAAAVS